jgi:hypothetical protein
MIYLVGSRQLTAFLKNLQPGSESEHHSHDPVDNMNEAHFPQSNVVDAAFAGSVAHAQHLTYGPVFFPTYIVLRTFLALYLPSFILVRSFFLHPFLPHVRSHVCIPFFLPSHTVLPPYLPYFVFLLLPSCKFLSFSLPYFLRSLSYLPSFCSPPTFVPSIIPAFVPPSYISSRL